MNRSATMPTSSGTSHKLSLTVMRSHVKYFHELFCCVSNCPVVHETCLASSRFLFSYLLLKVMQSLISDDCYEVSRENVLLDVQNV